MNISYYWLKQFIDVTHSPQETARVLTMIGLEVASVQQVSPVPGGLEGLLIGLVKDCVSHPHADRLVLTKVAIGSDQELQIVCGAPNIAVGQKVVVAQVGTTLYPINAKPFTIKQARIRGITSEGMICAADEIGLEQTQPGIMVLDKDAPIGRLVKDYLRLHDDYIFAINLTPNRADAASHLGVARDLAAYWNILIRKPAVATFKPDSSKKTPVAVIVENKADCLRYSSLSIAGVHIQASPNWLQKQLKAIGVAPINNVVDVTNYVLHELGQPLHAFDEDTISGRTVIVKNCCPGTLFQTLDKVTRTLSADDLMIRTLQEPLCLAGILGGSRSAVSTATQNIFLESAHFNPVAIRRSAKRHGLQTEASFRFERGTDPKMTIFALKRAALLIQQLAGGVIADIADVYPQVKEDPVVTLSYRNMDRLIGEKVARETIRKILQGLNITILETHAEDLLLKIPSYKSNITREVDVIEEILRIYGYNNIDLPHKVHVSLSHCRRPDKASIQNVISDWLSAHGFHEILCNSLTKSAYLNDVTTAVTLSNPLSADLAMMRQTLLFTGLEAIAYNQNRKSIDLKLYEFGKSYFYINNRHVEQQQFALFISGHIHAAHWSKPLEPIKFPYLKALVDALMDRLNIQTSLIQRVNDAKFQGGLTYTVDKQPLLSFGSISSMILSNWPIEKEVFYAEFDFDLLAKIVQRNKILYQETAKFPEVQRDLSLLLDTQVSFIQLKKIAHQAESKLLKEVHIFDIYQGTQLPANKKSYTLRFTLQDKERTLTDKTICAVMSKLVQAFETEVGALVRK